VGSFDFFCLVLTNLFRGVLPHDLVLHRRLLRVIAVSCACVCWRLLRRATLVLSDGLAAFHIDLSTQGVRRIQTAIHDALAEID